MSITPPMDHVQHLERQTMTLSQVPGDTTVELPSFDEARSQFIRSYLSQILQITGGNVSQAAKLAKRNRTDFYKLLQRYVLVPSDFKIYPT
jgi:two-component system response regulator GlrR